VKEKIHPKYYQAKVRCACGHEFIVGSTKEELRVDICSNCHPFFTGKQKFVDTAGRVDKYFRKYGDEAQSKFKKKLKKRKLTEEEKLDLESIDMASDASDNVVEESPAEQPAEPVAAAESVEPEKQEA